MRTSTSAGSPATVTVASSRVVVIVTGAPSTRATPRQSAVAVDVPLDVAVRRVNTSMGRAPTWAMTGASGMSDAARW